MKVIPETRHTLNLISTFLYVIRHILFPDNPRLPERPDFLARTVTSASLRRVDFYNSRDDENDEPEEKIFQHNFGASIRGGRGMFAVVNQEQDNIFFISIVKYFSVTCFAKMCHLTIVAVKRFHIRAFFL